MTLHYREEEGSSAFSSLGGEVSDQQWEIRY